MNIILNKPYLPIWLAMPFVLALSVIGPNRSLEIRFHDSYLIIPSLHVGILLSLMLGLIGAVYWLFRKKRLVKWITFIHVICTLLAFLLFVLIELTLKKTTAPYYRHDAIYSRGFMMIFAAFHSQVLLLINLLISLFRSKA